MQAVLVMFRSDGERRSFSMARDMTVIGRREDCDLRIPLGEVSRKHCRIVRDGDSLKIEDLGSSNGTFLNGQRVQEAMLSPGDTIQVGPVVFVLQVDGEPSDEALQPVMMSGAAANEGEDSDAGRFDEAGMTELSEGDDEPAIASSGARPNGGHTNGGGHLEELQPMGDSEDAAFDALMTSDDDDNTNLEELQIDLDAEEHDSAQPPQR